MVGYKEEPAFSVDFILFAVVFRMGGLKVAMIGSWDEYLSRD